MITIIPCNDKDGIKKTAKHQSHPKTVLDISYTAPHVACNRRRLSKYNCADATQLTPPRLTANTRRVCSYCILKPLCVTTCALDSRNVGRGRQANAPQCLLRFIRSGPTCILVRRSVSVGKMHCSVQPHLR